VELHLNSPTMPSWCGAN